MKPETELFRELVREQSTRKIFAKVFDKQTIETIHTLARQGHFEQLEFVIKTGKEAHVFRAIDKGGNYRAVKVYKIDASSFNNMEVYITGDERFKKIKKNKRSIVFAWVQKEFKNLTALKKAGIPVPTPIAVKNNVLVMEFIGTEGKAAPTVKESPPANLQQFRTMMAGFLAKMAYEAKIVHADLSEYNILHERDLFTLIDVGQAVLLSHPSAQEFFQRDVENIASYLTKKGLETSKNELLEEIRALKKEA